MKIIKKKVYVPLAVDFLHEGHINILKTAKKYGDVIVGLLSDEAIANYKTIPILKYKSRELLVKNLKYVSKVVPQKSEDYTFNLNKIRPDFLVHGDDWKYDNRKKIRNKVIKTLKKWSGKLIEPKHLVFNQGVLEPSKLKFLLKDELSQKYDEIGVYDCWETKSWALKLCADSVLTILKVD